MIIMNDFSQSEKFICPYLIFKSTSIFLQIHLVNIDNFGNASILVKASENVDNFILLANFA